MARRYRQENRQRQTVFLPAFLMGIKALYDQKALNDDDLKNAAAAYRPSPRGTDTPLSTISEINNKGQSATGRLLAGIGAGLAGRGPSLRLSSQLDSFRPAD